MSILSERNQIVGILFLSIRTRREDAYMFVIMVTFNLCTTLVHHSFTFRAIEIKSSLCLELDGQLFCFL